MIAQKEDVMLHPTTERSTTLTTGSTSISNTSGYVSVSSIIVKIIEVVLGTICIGIAGYDIRTRSYKEPDIIKLLIAGEEVRFYLVDQTTCRIIFFSSTAFFTIISLIQLILCRVSISTGPIISRTICGVIYHSIGFGLLLAASMTVHERLNRLGKYFLNYDIMLAAAIIGIVNSAFYLISAIIAQRSSIVIKINTSDSSNTNFNNITDATV